jgi:hypothetical protein
MGLEVPIAEGNPVGGPICVPSKLGQLPEGFGKSFPVDSLRVLGTYQQGEQGYIEKNPVFHGLDKN